MTRKTEASTPRSTRKSVSMRGFALSEKRDADICVTDLSYEGCRIHSDVKFKKGESVELRILGRGRVDAEVRWVGDGDAGIKFVS
jgi:hypothetical protein